MRPDHERACKRHALLLAAGHAPRKAFGKAAQAHEIERVLHPLVTLGAPDFLHLQAKGDILGRGHMGKQRVALKYDAETATVRLHRYQIAAVERYRAGGRLNETGNHLQRRRFAAA